MWEQKEQEGLWNAEASLQRLMDEPTDTKKRQISGRRWKLFSSLRLSICQDKWHHETFVGDRRRLVGGCGVEPRRHRESSPEAPAVAITAQWAAGPEQSGRRAPSAVLRPIILISGARPRGRWITHLPSFQRKRSDWDAAENAQRCCRNHPLTFSVDRSP